jgi:hypothetical protein
MGTGVPVASRRPAAEAKGRFVTVFNRLDEFAVDTGFRYVA